MILKKSVLLALVVFVLPLAAMAKEEAAQLSLKNLRLVEISQLDRLATAKGPDGALRLIRVGDQLGKGARVTEISKGRVVVEESTEKGVETVIIVLDKGVQKVERIRNKSAEAKPLVKTRTVAVPVPAHPVQ